MKTLHIEVPDKLAQELDTLVQAGWFSHEAEVVRLDVHFVNTLPVPAASGHSRASGNPGAALHED